jgi:GT2 family glycosyltransferase
VAVVCGRRRERRPDASLYHRLCDREWDTPVGLADSCGGDALFRVSPLLGVGGFSEDLIAGEEPDLCHRIRGTGWRIRRIAGEMTLHDAAMTRFAQWWQRSRRSGYATAEALVLRGRAQAGLWRQVISNVVWALPLSWPLWPLFWLRLCVRRGPLEASFLVLGKLPHCQGQVDYWRQRQRLIEYK